MDRLLTRKTFWLWHAVSFVLLMAAGVLVYHYSGSPYFQEAVHEGMNSGTPGAATLARQLLVLQMVNSVLLISLLGSFIGLVIICLKDAPKGAENWYTEVNLLGAVTSILIAYVGVNEIRYGYLIHEGLDVLAGAVIFSFAWFLMILAVLCLILSVFRKSFLEQMLIYQGLKAVYEGIKDTNDTTGSGIRIVYLFMYQIFNISLAVGSAAALISGRAPVGILLLAILAVINLRYLTGVAEKRRQQKEIYDRVSRMAIGDVGSRIDTTGMTGEARRMADTVNRLNDSMELAVKERTRSERMRAELIANVSHDLRTPLTSIINYVDLLRRENIPNPKVDEYLNVLEEKSMRLKTMSEALMEASRAASGSIRLNMEEIDMVQMLHQVYGEFQDMFEEKALTPVLSLIEPPAIIRADGEMLWRVLDNLFTNVLKYARPGTQVLIELVETAHSVIFTMKNVSEHSIDFAADELTERFVRGDNSRSTEGSGLGLSIAKSMTENLGGRFDIFIDEDMFRVRLVFPLAVPNVR